MKSVIVFGGSLGIGKKIAFHFLENKYNATVFARAKSNLELFRREAEDKGMHANIQQGDVGNIDDVKNAFKEHKKNYGSFPSYVINTAGIQGALGPAWSLSQADFENVIKVNLTGSFNVSKTAIENLIGEKKSGSIILFSGGGSCYARPNFSSYGVSKTGVIRLVETIAEELKQNGLKGIIINAVSPGAVRTRMTEEVLNSKERAGDKAFGEAKKTMENGGTRLKDVIELVDFLCNNDLNKGLSGRLIHFRDDYKKFAEIQKDKIHDDAGKLRRVKLI